MKLKILFVCSVLFVVVATEHIHSGYEKREFQSDDGTVRIGFVNNEQKHCKPAQQVINSKHNPWIASHLTTKLREIENDKAERQARKMKNEENLERIMKHLAANPYSMLNQNSLPNLIESDDFSTHDHAKNRVKRMNENEEIDHLQLQANIDHVFKSSSSDSSKLIDNNVIDEISDIDPALQENINNVFGFATSERLLAQNVQNYDHNEINHLKEQTDSEELDSTIEDFDSTTKGINLNEMILKNFGSEILDDDPESTTEYRFRDDLTLHDKYKHMAATNSHHSTPTDSDTSSSGDGNLSSSTKNPDADTVKAASRSSDGLASTSIPYLVTLVFFYLHY